jgi:hypothetical protein
MGKFKEIEILNREPDEEFYQPTFVGMMDIIFHFSNKKDEDQLMTLDDDCNSEDQLAFDETTQL